MAVFQDDAFQTDFIQDGSWIPIIEDYTIPFRLYEFSELMQSFDILQTWFDAFQIPNFHMTWEQLNDPKLIDLAKIKSKLRDKGILQTSSGVIELARWERRRQLEVTKIIKAEIFKGLSQAMTCVTTHMQYYDSISVILTETNRVFLAGELTIKQLEIETRIKDELWNLRVVHYGCIVMASIIPGKVFSVKVPQKTTAGRIMSVYSWGAMGASVGSAVGPIGTMVGAVVGFVVGIALEFL